MCHKHNAACGYIKNEPPAPLKTPSTQGSFLDQLRSDQEKANPFSVSLAALRFKFGCGFAVLEYSSRSVLSLYY